MEEKFKELKEMMDLAYDASIEGFNMALDQVLLFIWDFYFSNLRYNRKDCQVSWGARHWVYGQIIGPIHQH